jgi:thioredoxin-like negative regulator of GroEL
MRPIIDKLKSEGFDIQIIDVDKDKDSSTKYKISLLPTTVILYEDKEKARYTGKITEENLRNYLSKVKPDYRFW